MSIIVQLFTQLGTFNSAYIEELGSYPDHDPINRPKAGSIEEPHTY